jgi:hypothetical protein
LQYFAETQAWRLLCFLLVWVGEMPTHSARQIRLLRPQPRHKPRIESRAQKGPALLSLYAQSGHAAKATVTSPNTPTAAANNLTFIKNLLEKHGEHSRISGCMFQPLEGQALFFSSVDAGKI